MKKLILMVGFAVIAIVIGISIWIVNGKGSNKIKFDEGLDKDRIARVQIHTPGVKELNTEDKSKIFKIISKLNTVTFSKRANLQLANEGTDAWIAMFDKNGSVIGKLQFYGDVAVYKGERYKIATSIYDTLESMCYEFK